MLLAYDTELRLQEEGLSNNYKLEEWWVEAGPKYFDETVVGVREAVSQTAIETAKRPSASWNLRQSRRGAGYSFQFRSGTFANTEPDNLAASMYSAAESAGFGEAEPHCESQQLVNA